MGEKTNSLSSKVEVHPFTSTDRHDARASDKSCSESEANANGFALRTSNDAISERRGQASVPLRPLVRTLVISSILAALVLFSLDNTIVADVQPDIIDTLGHIDKLPWISVAFALGGIATNLFWGKLYGCFDNKLLFIVSVILFEAGSVLCGAAPTMNALIIGRAVCGVGGMGLYLGAINIISRLTSEVERPVFMGIVGVTWGVGTVLGPIIGGAFSDSAATWRWAFYINLCVGGAISPVLLLLLPRLPIGQGRTLLHRVRKLDFTGAVLIAGMLASLIMAVSFGGIVFSWSSGQIIGLFVCAGVLLIAFTVQQYFTILTTPEDRLFPVAFLKNGEMLILFGETAGAQFLLYVPLFFLPIYFQFARADTALQAGVRILPSIVFTVTGGMLNGAMMAKFGYYMPWYLVGSALALVGSCLMHTLRLDTGLARIYGYEILLALGNGLFSQASYAVAQVRMEREMIAPAVAFICVAQVGGIALALTISNSIFLNQATAKIAAVMPHAPLSEIQAAISGVHAAAFLDSLTSSDRTKLLEAVVESVDEVFFMLIAAAALCLLLSAFLSREKLFAANAAPTSTKT